MIATIDGALQSVDASLYESATLDGAGFFQKVRFITVPGIRAIIAPAAVMTTFITSSSLTLCIFSPSKRVHDGSRFEHRHHLCYQNAFVSNNYGLSSAVSMLLFVLIILFSLATNRSLREE